jgi:hypothetical protein
MCMRKNKLIACIVVILISVAAHAVPSAVVTLRVDPDHTLPGLPSMLQVSVDNTGAEPLSLTGAARMTVSDAAGNRFLAIGRTENPNVDVFTLWDDPNLIIPPGANRDFFWRTTASSNAPVFFDDPRFRTPGKYLVRLELLTTDRTVSFVSNDAAFTVETPLGVDATVWSLIVAGGGVRDPTGLAVPSVGAKIAPAVLAQYATSRYAPFLIPWFNTKDNVVRERLYRWALTQPLPKSFAAELEVHLLSLYSNLMLNGLGYFDIDQALAYRAKTQQFALTLKGSTYPFVRDAVTATMADLPTVEQLTSRFEQRLKTLPPATQSVSPFVQCADPGSSESDDLLVVFGYSSGNQFGKYLPPGDGNELRPEHIDGVLPRFFGPGNQKNVLSIVSKEGEAVTWTLDGHSATGTRKSDRCAPPTSPAPITVLLDCVQIDGDNVVATFGYISANAVAVRIPEGPANKPTGEVRPPTIFLAGEHHGALTVRGKRGESPAWTLQGTTVTSSASGVPCNVGEDDK